MNCFKRILPASILAFFLSCAGDFKEITDEERQARLPQSSSSENLSSSDVGVSSSSSVSNHIAICNGNEYNSMLYDCIRGEIVGSCKGVDYYPKYQRCVNGNIEDGTEISSSSNPSSSSEGDGQSSSSGSEGDVLSSSSDEVVESSSSVAPSSSSDTPSSSSATLSSSSLAPSSSSATQSSSSATSSSSNEGELSSSSEAPSSNSAASSSSEGEQSSNSVASSSSAPPSSSSVEVSSSSSCTASDNTTERYCSNGEMKDYGSFTDNRIDTRQIPVKTYKTVVIGDQTWMAENLNYNTEDNKSRCYGNTNYNDNNNCTTYGRLYNWATAMGLSQECNSKDCSEQVIGKHQGVCPNGWHIPSNLEWLALMNEVGGVSTAAKHLKAQSGWNSCSLSDCSNTYGFSALPGGYHNSANEEYNAGVRGYWWSSTNDYGNNSFLWRMSNNEDDAWFTSNMKVNLYSVRCLKDD